MAKKWHWEDVPESFLDVPEEERQAAFEASLKDPNRDPRDVAMLKGAELIAIKSAE